MSVVLPATIILVDFSVAIMQLEVSAAFMQVKVSAKNMWVTIFIEITDVGVSVAIMQRVFSAVHYAPISIVIMQVAVSVVAMYVT